MHESATKIDRHAASADIAALSVLLPCSIPVNVTTYLSVSESESESERERSEQHWEVGGSGRSFSRPF
jgi:hypothetical protein